MSNDTTPKALVGSLACTDAGRAAGLFLQISGIAYKQTNKQMFIMVMF